MAAPPMATVGNHSCAVSWYRCCQNIIYRDHQLITPWRHRCDPRPSPTLPPFPRPTDRSLTHGRTSPAVPTWSARPCRRRATGACTTRTPMTIPAWSAFRPLRLSTASTATPRRTPPRASAGSTGRGPCHWFMDARHSNKSTWHVGICEIVRLCDAPDTLERVLRTGRAAMRPVAPSSASRCRRSRTARRSTATTASTPAARPSPATRATSLSRSPR